MPTDMKAETKVHDDHHMSCSVAFNPSRKRQYLEPHPYASQHQLKRQKLDKSATTYWDNLSKIWLTKDALKELDRRNSRLKLPQNHRPITRRFYTELKKFHESFQFAPEFLRNCSPKSSKQIKRLSRFGGPDLSDLRHYPEPMSPSKSRSRSRKRRAGSSPPSQTGDTKGTTKTASTSAYSRNFQQNLIDHGVYPPAYEYPDGRRPAKPDNWEEINERLAQPRASLSPSRFSEEAFEKFTRADAHASKEQPVTTSVIPIIEGDIGDPKCAGGGYAFGNFAPLTDGTLAQPKPDRFYGARPEQLNRQIRKELSDHIIPSTQDDLPMAPNFFLEAKGPDGSLAVATRQACYNGAEGTRANHSLRSYRQTESAYDNNAYTLTSTYHGGTLKLYTTHPVEPACPDRHPEYIMTQLKGWSMTSDLETFRQGASAFRNARDWAKKQRDEFIRSANERHSEGHCPVSQQQTVSNATLILNESDVSTASDEAEYHDAQWSFTAPVEDEEGGSQTLARNVKRPRVSAIVPDDTAGKTVTSLPN